MAAPTAHPPPLAESTFYRQTPEVGARCANRARRDLRGGCTVTCIPTALRSATRFCGIVRAAHLLRPACCESQIQKGVREAALPCTARTTSLAGHSFAARRPPAPLQPVVSSEPGSKHYTRMASEASSECDFIGTALAQWLSVIIALHFTRRSRVTSGRRARRCASRAISSPNPASARARGVRAAIRRRVAANRSARDRERGRRTARPKAQRAAAEGSGRCSDSPRRPSA